MDAISAGIRHTQKLHIHQGTAYRCCYSQGRQGAQRLGLGHREAETKRGELSGTCVYRGKARKDRLYAIERCWFAYSTH